MLDQMDHRRSFVAEDNLGGEHHIRELARRGELAENDAVVEHHTRACRIQLEGIESQHLL